jgi:hypothetical protein
MTANQRDSETPVVQLPEIGGRSPTKLLAAEFARRLRAGSCADEQTALRVGAQIHSALLFLLLFLVERGQPKESKMYIGGGLLLLIVVLLLVFR